MGASEYRVYRVEKWGSPPQWVVYGPKGHHGTYHSAEQARSVADALNTEYLRRPSGGGGE